MVTDRGPHLARRHSRRPFVIVLIAWGIGLFGLSDGSISALQLTVLTVAGLLCFSLVAAARRRRIEQARERVTPGSGSFPQPCVVVRWLGDAGTRTATRT